MAGGFVAATQRRPSRLSSSRWHYCVLHTGRRTTARLYQAYVMRSPWVCRPVTGMVRLARSNYSVRHVYYSLRAYRLSFSYFPCSPISLFSSLSHNHVSKTLPPALSRSEAQSLPRDDTTPPCLAYSDEYSESPCTYADAKSSSISTDTRTYSQTPIASFPLFFGAFSSLLVIIISFIITHLFFVQRSVSFGSHLLFEISSLSII